MAVKLSKDHIGSFVSWANNDATVVGKVISYNDKSKQYNITLPNGADYGLAANTEIDVLTDEDYNKSVQALIEDIQKNSAEAGILDKGDNMKELQDKIAALEIANAKLTEDNKKLQVSLTESEAAVKTADSAKSELEAALAKAVKEAADLNASVAQMKADKLGKERLEQIKATKNTVNLGDNAVAALANMTEDAFKMLLDVAKAKDTSDDNKSEANKSDPAADVAKAKLEKGVDLANAGDLGSNKSETLHAAVAELSSISTKRNKRKNTKNNE